MKRSCRSLILGVLCAGTLLVGDLAATPRSYSWEQAPDNTAVNKADHNTDAPTADQAKNNMSDRELMRHIRQDVVKDKSLSTDGHNVKIVATHGKVTLRGPVHSEDEKKAIEEHAKKYAGDGNIDNQISVKSS